MTRSRVELSPRFWEISEELAGVATVESPSAEQIQRVVDLTRANPDIARFFFQRAESASWYGPLKVAGLMTLVLEPQQEGTTVRSRPWSAAPYVMRLAPAHAEIVLELIKELQGTLNWHVQSTLSEAALSLPAEMAAEALPILFQWKSSPYGTVSLVDHHLLSLLTKLEEASSDEVALNLLSRLIEPSAGDWAIRLQIEEHDFERITPVVDR